MLGTRVVFPPRPRNHLMQLLLHVVEFFVHFLSAIGIRGAGHAIKLELAKTRLMNEAIVRIIKGNPDSVVEYLVPTTAAAKRVPGYSVGFHVARASIFNFKRHLCLLGEKPLKIFLFL